MKKSKKGEGKYGMKGNQESSIKNMNPKEKLEQLKNELQIPIKEDESWLRNQYPAIPSKSRDKKNHICSECGYKWSCARFRNIGNCPASSLICAKCFFKNDSVNTNPTHGEWFTKSRVVFAQ